MTKTFSAKCWIALISCCCIGTGIALACAGDWGEEYGTSNFSPEVFVDSAYTPFFYSQQFYYKIGHDEIQDSRFNDQNLIEWSAFFSNQVNKDELQYLLEKATPGSIDSTADFIAQKTTTIPASLQAFNLLKQKNNNRLPSFISYLQLAKKSEAFALNNITGSWDYEEKAKNKKAFDARTLDRNLLTAFGKTTDPFLKERYWFQLVRSYFFNSVPTQAIDFFNAHEKDMPRNNMYYRTLAYTAGAFYKLKDYSRANYYYSKVYQGCDELKTVAHYSFHPQEEKDWNATLALCKSNEEKSTLWQMLGIFYADEQRAIRAIYQLTPGSDKLDVLLARAVNKYEQRFNSSGDAPAAVDTVATAALPALVANIANAANTGKPWTWQMAAGYLKTLNGNYAEASAWLAKAEKTIPNKPAAQAQLRLLKLINTIAQAKRADSRLEAQILNDVDWLRTFNAKVIPELRYNDAYEWLKQQLAKKYQQQKDWVKAECFVSKTVFYTDNNRVEALKTFLEKKNKTPYEQLCTALSVKKTDDLFEYQAIHLAYADSIDEAIEKMSQAPAGGTTELLGNPFNARIKDCHDCDHEALQKIKYTKLTFLKKLAELKSKVAAKEDLYTNSLLLANAYYNMSHFGNARVFYESAVIGAGQYDPYSIDTAFRKMLTATNKCTQYYTMALNNAATDEQRAKCQYLLAKCQRNQWYNEHVYNKRDGYTEETLVDFNALDGFRALQQYSNTQYYKDVIKECGYFKTYTSKKKTHK